MVLVELLVGLFDVEGEDFLVVVQCELVEEVMLLVDDWWVFVDIVIILGGCQEFLCIYLVWGFYEVLCFEGFLLEGEEVLMKVGWELLDDFVEVIYVG